MQFTKLSLGLLAATAAAYSYDEPQHIHPRFYNTTTAAAGGEMTTLTLFTTSIHTVLSCAASITDCPARSATGGIVVTETIALTTTVCPVTEAQAASSAIAASYSAGIPASTAGGVTATTPSVPIGTGGSYPAASPTVSVGAVPTGSVVVTYTQGAGTSTTVITSTILQYSTQTVYATLPPAGGESGVPSGSGTFTNTAEGVEGSSTTTLTSTQTTTKYVTIAAVSSAAGGAGPSGDACAPPVTVTVTETVTAPAVATATAAGTVGLPGTQNQAASSSPGPVVVYSTVNVVPIFSSASPSASGAGVATSSAAVIPPPMSSVASYPYTNGTTTAPVNPSGRPSGYPSGYPTGTPSGYTGLPGSSGFLSVVKPTFSHIEPHKPSHTHASKPTPTGYRYFWAF